MKKTIPFMFTILAIASIASIAVLGNTQTAYAGNGCTIDPVMVDFGDGLDEDDSARVQKTIECSEEVIGISPDTTDCDNKGLSITFENDVLDNNKVVFDEVVLVIDGGPAGEKLTCTVIFEIDLVEDSMFLTQTIMLTAPTPPPPTVVGGELLPIDSTALVLAGLQTSAIWMLPVLAGVAGSAFGILYIKSRRN